VRSLAQPGDIKRAIPTSPPIDPEDPEHLLRDIDQVVAPGLTHWTHPQFFGYFPCNGELSGVLGDYLSTGIGALGLTWQSSPALSEIEEVAVDWMRQMLGLSDSWRGVIQDTASTSSLIALLCARERTTRFSLARGGLQAEPRPLVVYATSESHSSIRKAALLAGFGADHFRVVAHDAQLAMDPAALETAVKADIAAGRTPCAIVATVGTTATTAMDPLDAIATVAHRHALWLHVDAAMAGSAMILPECRWMWSGVERADSVIVNAHKWLGAPFDCSLYYVRDAAHLVRVMSTQPSYLQTAHDTEVTTYRDWGLPLGRRFRALKLWWVIREQGVSGLQARLRRDLENARWLAGEVDRAPGWRVLVPVVLQTVCIRHLPGDVSADALDRHTLGWIDRINASGQAFLTPARFTPDGRWMARVSIGALATEREHVQRVWTAMMAAARDGGLT
jgi:glutamate/tyrosine decarboxylase-like PLP-dependent enzyme